MSDEYEQIISGRWYPLLKKWDHACCDCHLVHEITIRTHEGKPQIRFKVLKKETRQLRRLKRKPNGAPDRR